MTLDEKRDQLLCTLRAYGSLAVAFSGGVDSSFLLKAAQEALGDRVLAITVVSDFIPERERKEALDFCRQHRIRHELLRAEVLAIPGVKENPPDRCYLCKRALFERMSQSAGALGFPHLAEGSNLDDEGDYRPGMRAVRELGVLSPLRQAGLTKAEIRVLSERMGLPTWNKPSFACLASRFAYGEALTVEGLRRVEQAEEQLRRLGFRQYRVRVHGDLARIELLPEDFSVLLQEERRKQLNGALKALGFSYVTLDLAGFRSGSMNETLPPAEKK